MRPAPSPPGPLPRAQRLATALADLVAQGDMLIREGNPLGLPALLGRAEPLVDELCRLAPLLGADADQIRNHLESVRNAWSTQLSRLAVERSRVSDELSELSQGSRRLRRLRPSYAAAQPGRGAGVGAALSSQA